MNPVIGFEHLAPLVLLVILAESAVFWLGGRSDIKIAGRKI
jgi:hypothetical protein